MPIEATIHSAQNKCAANRSEDDKKAEEKHRCFYSTLLRRKCRGVAPFHRETKGELLNVALENYHKKIPPKIELPQQQRAPPLGQRFEA